MCFGKIRYWTMTPADLERINNNCEADNKCQ